MEARYLNMQEIADYFSVSRATIQEWIRRGCPNIQPFGPKSRRFFDPEEVVAWLKEMQRDGKKGARATKKPSRRSRRKPRANPTDDAVPF